ncbi:four helix bundle protein [Robertkochia aurantiaca]|uniref:four helix bundle protein n=1 Tax=Robertkochia aurantiaca TaxID=2873700 RepID=UPI001CCC62D0|nr:four helix bundle protein [Robertkochia sp. 3YJGBD-33]
MDSHKDLRVYKRSIELVKIIYKITESFPETEKYGLASQMKRCAISVPSNIAEGSARKSRKELRQFLYISLGSLSELDTQIHIAQELNFTPADNGLQSLVNHIKAMLINLIKSI